MTRSPPRRGDEGECPLVRWIDALDDRQSEADARVVRADALHARRNGSPSVETNCGVSSSPVFSTVSTPLRASALARATPCPAREHRSRPPAAAVPVPAAATGARRDRDAARRARGAHLGRRRRAARPLARLAGRQQDEPRPMGECAPGAVRSRDGALCPRRPHPRPARVPGVRRRPLPHRDRASVHRGRRAGVLAARFAAQADLAASFWAAFHGRGSASTSGSATSPRPRTRTATCSPMSGSSTTLRSRRDRVRTRGADPGADPGCRKTVVCRVGSAPVGGMRGRLAQLAEHLLYTQGVGGSIPSPPMPGRAANAALLFS